MNDRFTTYGKDSLMNRLNSLCKILANPEQKYPVKYKVLGFGNMQLNSDKEVYWRVKELSEILNVDVEISLNVKIKEEEDGN